MREKILEVLRKENNKVNENTELIKSGIINSFVLTNIVIELEDVLEIQIPFDKVTAENFKDLDAIESLIKSL